MTTKIFDRYLDWYLNRRDEIAAQNPKWAEIEARRRNPNLPGITMFSEEDGLGWNEWRTQNEIERAIMPRDRWWDFPHGMLWNLHWWAQRQNPRAWIRGLKYFYQRGKRGWADIDWWNMSYYSARVMSEMLAVMAERSHGWPGEASEWPTFEDWQAYLRSMAEDLAFLASDDLTDVPDDIAFSDEPGRREARKAHYEQTKLRHDETIERVFANLAKGWSGLWD